ncbi:MAG: TrkH family potassium uptake protein [Deltaproteobacteria bacterium]|nr:TrkH family potassium uptake protein [Deltaproteobacteria bacterium]
MKIRPVLYLISYALLFIALAMCAGALWAIYFHEDLIPFVYAIVITLITGLFGIIVLREEHLDQQIGAREGYGIASLGWTVITLFSALPLVFSGFFTPTDAFFEIMSGYTTTGASILTDVEKLPKGILFWRSLTHWFGGMGIVVLMVAVLPNLAVGGLQMLKGEVPGPSVDKLGPRIRRTAQWLWVVYLAVSLLEIVLLLLGGMGLFDACTHTFGTMATGGFSTKNASVGYFNSVYIDGVITFFMFVAGVNFTLHYQLIFGKRFNYFKSSEFVFYSAVILVSWIALTWDTMAAGLYTRIVDAVRFAGFQTVSIVTTTGFCTADTNTWPAFSKIVLTILMFLGGCAGSTGGGIKHVRILILIKTAYRELFRAVHPRVVRTIRVGKQVIDESMVSSIVGFFVIYLGVFTLGAAVIGIFGFDFVTSVEAVAATLNNIGPGFGLVGATGNYSAFPDAAKWIFSFLMLAGRLEIYSVLLLLVPAFWKR